mmetsp:Transcript_28604/g.62221  ORF Transcript_28604/g.62221 Transcript_28604/m.62221 type:complete len:571 (-) Transcript_28604:537-2249(-)
MALQTVKYLRKAAKRCVAHVLRGAPPEPEMEVLQMVKAFRIQKPQLVQIYDVFHYLRQKEDEDKLLVDVLSIQSDSVRRMVRDNRKWVLRLLVRLVDLGGCKESISWNSFLWIFVRFCSLNKMELAQALFLLIQTEVASPTVHYLHADQLEQFYSFYKDCPVTAFDTTGISFQRLPLERWYASDFVELTQRFEVLLNPILDLQRTLQGHIPGTDFWDQADLPLNSRKISFDFFVMGTSRVHLRGEPVFRETCDLLMPDALGSLPLNVEQWVLRTSHRRDGKGLRQVSVWGEQASPEVLSQIKERLALEAEAAQKAEAERLLAAATAAAAARRRWALALAAPTEEDDAPKAKAGDDPADQESVATGEHGESPGAKPSRPSSANSGNNDSKDQSLSPTKTMTREEQVPPSAPIAAWAPNRSAGQTNSTKKNQTTATAKAKAKAAGGRPNKPPIDPVQPAAGAAPPPPGQSEQEEVKETVLDPHLLSLYAATVDETHMGPMDVLPPSWMKSATITPAPQLPNWGCPPKKPIPSTLGRVRGNSWRMSSSDVGPNSNSLNGSGLGRGVTWAAEGQ